MRLFDEKTDCGICLETALPAVRLAAQDLQRDLRRLSGRQEGFEIGQEGALRICLGGGAPESYTVEVGQGVTVTGADELGCIYGIYDFERRCLGIHPTSPMTELFPQPRKSLSLQPQRFSEPARPVRWRGWFLNDEDLLTQLRISGGKRNIDYPFYGDVMDVQVLDRVLETALRLQINLVIPASFVDIMNPAERRLVDAVCARGLYISQHHVEPVGVSYFAADAYMQKQGAQAEEVSFISNRPRMEEIWLAYIKSWAQYSPRVIWQLGLRGKGDQAVWKADPNAPMTDEARGALITDAIATQHRMITETVGGSFVSTATLWNEGSALYGKGFLKLPEGTVAIFSDFGISQMFGEDFCSMPRLAGKQYGVYYHCAFWALGPHLTEGCRPRKMVYSLKEAARRNSLHYAILNVSNVRPVHYGAMVFSEIMKDPLGADADAITARLDQELFGTAGGRLNGLRRAYYDAFADFGREVIRKTADRWQFYYHSHEAAPFVENAVTDGYLAYFTRGLLRGSPCAAEPELGIARQALEESERKFSALWEQLQDPTLPDSPYLDQFLRYQTCHMLLLTQWSLAVMDMLAGVQGAQSRACGLLRTLLERRRVLEQGYWAFWHRGDQKIDIPLLLRMTEQWRPQSRQG